MNEKLQLVQYSCKISLDEYRKRYQDIERILGYCKSCRNYGQQWVCPPFDFNINSVLDQFNLVEIYGFKLHLPKELLTKRYTLQEQCDIGNNYMVRVRAIIDPQIWEMEQNVPGSRAFYAGSCHLCDPIKCSRVCDPPSPCRYPMKARNSLENFGFDLNLTASELLGTPMLWGKDGKLPLYYFYISALMY